MKQRSVAIRDNSGSWLTAKRLRAHGIVLGVCLWSVYVWNVSSPGIIDRNGLIKGTDFIHLYTLGSVALEHRASDLYSLDAQAELAARRIPAATGIRYLPLYPPQVSIFFAPLATLPYATALTTWLIMNFAIYGLCCGIVWHACPRLRNDRWTVLLLALAFPGFFHLILWGQTSAMALACFTAAFLFLRDDRPFLAGVALGCLMFKPQLGIAAAFVFTYTRAWRVLAGGILSAAVQLAVPAIYYGPESLRSWMRTISHVFGNMPLLEPKPYQTHSLRTFWTMIIPGVTLPFALYMVSALVILGLATAVWSHRPILPLGLRYSSLLLASVLVAPHLFVYDLVILIPAFLLLSDWAIAEQSPTPASNLKIFLYLVYLSPLVGPLTRWTHVQVSVVLMSVLVYMIWRVGLGGVKTIAFLPSE